MRRFFRPKSFFFLVLMGFLVIALPLILVLVSAEISMNRLATQSVRMVLNSVEVTQESSKLIEHVVSLERMARQYYVLRDPLILSNLDAKQKELLSSLKTLEEHLSDTKQKDYLARVQQGVNQLRTALNSPSPDNQILNEALEGFFVLNPLARRIHLAGQDLVVQETKKMLAVSETERSDLMLQAFLFIGLTMVSIVLFSRLILCPIREIDQGIRRLGEGDYTHSITITGPEDLEFLGKRLDWLRERLGEVEKEKNKFLAHVSHELKTPLASILQGSELLSEEVVGELNDPQREISKILCKNSMHLHKLIDNLLGFRAHQAKLAQFLLRPVNLAMVVEDVLEDQHPTILKKDLKLDSSLENLDVLGDWDRLRIVVDNLISNAVKFTPKGGRILLKIFHDRERGMLEVADSGPGVPPEEREKIFHPFYQGGIPVQGHIKGTGLGLAIVKEYVQDHGGQVFVGEGSLGGALFRVAFPLDLDRNPA